ncbi:hypothetical protein EJ02DRAFT_432988 [Clathrospora elynae]|uniref:DUF4419 domain-containing protein n=1 Tax=Clathrospora elynae TaxID=706981 RepID=A0A6A5SUN8_9PLEO|nr:hypothetical protein EJ02DRAFT_432988 [Clathrospora elynae]
MPATLKIADHPSESWKRQNITSSADLLKGSSRADYEASKWIIQSSISRDEYEKTHITPSQNGFVYAAFYAYNQHHHLTIRPDDVWLAILSQLNFYINAHAEELRNYFVSHKGQKELEVEDVGNIRTVDFGRLARRMTTLIQNNVNDPSFWDWILLAFSTTTVCDRTTAAVLMMGSMQAYFSFMMTCTCGLPSVTLLGEREDYEDILQRLDKLPELGTECAQFADLLRPVLRNFVSSFEPQPSPSTRSGPDFLSGWLTAFCFWNNDGKCLYRQKNVDHLRAWERACELDGIAYHQVATEEIPNGFASVPVKVNDNGTTYHTKMIAGAIGIQATSSGGLGAEGDEPGAAEGDKLDTLQPLSGWFMYEIKENKASASSQEYETWKYETSEYETVSD